MRFNWSSNVDSFLDNLAPNLNIFTYFRCLQNKHLFLFYYKATFTVHLGFEDLFGKTQHHSGGFDHLAESSEMR